MRRLVLCGIAVIALLAPGIEAYGLFAGSNLFKRIAPAPNLPPNAPRIGIPPRPPMGIQPVRPPPMAIQTQPTASAVPPTLYAVDPAGSLVWNRHLGHADGAPSWKSGANRVVGSGWSGFRHVFAGANGSIYVVRPNGELAEYLHIGHADGAAAWQGPKVVGTGWGDAKLVFAAPAGIIYAVMRDGTLRWYRHLGQSSLTPGWAAATTVGTGWGGFDLVIAAPGGVIYARKPNGQLLWYRHLGQHNGTSAWAPGSGNVVGSNRFVSMAAGPNGTLYGLQSNGDLLWYRHLGAADGNSRWVGGGTGKKIGSGWAYKHLFALTAEGGARSGEGAPPVATPAPRPPAAPPRTLAAAFQGDPQAGTLHQAMQRPEVKAQLEAALARVTAADSRLGAAIRNLATLVKNPLGALGQWKTKNVCGNVPSCRTVRRTRQVNDCKWKRGCKKVKFLGVDFSVCGCRKVCVFGKCATLCADRYWDCSDKKTEAYNAQECSMVRQCKDVRYFDPTAGTLYKAARAEAQRKLDAARAAFNKLKADIARTFAAAKGALEKAKTAAALLAKRTWKDVQDTATRLWASATEGAKAIFRKVFSFVVDMVLKLVYPIVSKTSVAMSPRVEGPWERFASLLRRQSSAAPWCGAEPRTNWTNDPLRRVQHAFSIALKLGMMMATSAMGYTSVWSKFFGVAEVARWKGWRPEAIRKATKVSQAAEWLKQMLRIPALIEALEDLKTSLARGKNAAKELWAAIDDAAKGTGAKLKGMLSSLGRKIADAAKSLGDEIGPPLRRFGAAIRDGVSDLALSAKQGLAARAATLKAWVGRQLKTAWQMLLKQLRPVAKAIKSPTARLVADLLFSPFLVDRATQVWKRLVASSGGEGILKKIGKKVLGLWGKFKGVAGPFLASMAARMASSGGKAASAAAKAKAFFAKAATHAAKAAKKLGAGPLMAAAQWAALAIAYPYADAECATQAPGAYRACYLSKFTAFSKQVFFDAVVGTAMEALDAALITPASVALTAAVSAAVAASFTPATAATAGAVIGIGTKFAVIVGLTVAADLLFPWYEQTVWKKGAQVPAYFEQRGDEGADLFSAFRLHAPDRNQGLLCQGRNFKHAGESAGYDGLEMSNYGNWCGPGGGGTPIDVYDQCCQAHDKCYETNNCSITASQCSSACYSCDKVAVKCWQAARRAQPKRYGSGNTLTYPCHACATQSRSLPMLRQCNKAACFTSDARGLVAPVAAAPNPTTVSGTPARPATSAPPTTSVPPATTPAAIIWRQLVGQAIHCGPGGCLSGGPGCDTRAVPGQCSFPRGQAQALCARHPECKAVTCNGGRSDCQARKVTKPSPWRGFTSFVSSKAATPAPITWRQVAGHAINCGPGGCLSAGPGCDTRAVPGQCSFPRGQAQALCARHPECKAVTCNGGRSDCQARKVTKPSPWRGFTSFVSSK